MPLSSQVHKLSTDLGVDYNGDVVLYDTRGYSATRREVLTDDEMEALIEWYYGDKCPVCGVDIPDGAIICDSCYDEAGRHPSRADEIHIKEQRIYERGIAQGGQR